LLVPYQELPELEKEYDRVTVSETLKSILALGFEIAPPKETGLESSLPAADLVARLNEAHSLRELLKIWRTTKESSSTEQPEIYRLLSERLLKIGEPLIAYDAAAEGLRRWNQDLRLTQLLALALARCGAPEPSNQILRDLWERNVRDPETSGVLARTHKDLWLRLHGTANSEQHLTEAHRLYATGYVNARNVGDGNGAVYNGINAASTALLLGEQTRAGALAREVLQLCAELNQNDYWARATQAEAALVLGDVETAAGLYGEAAVTALGSSADLSTTRKQARLLLAYLGFDPHRLDRCFPIPSVLVLLRGSGLEGLKVSFDQLREEFEKTALSMRRSFVYVTILGYPDLALVEAFVNGGHEVHAVLPFTTERHNCIASEHGISQDRVCATLERCADVVITSEHRQTGTYLASRYAELVRDGLALLHAQALDTNSSVGSIEVDGERFVLVPGHVAHGGIADRQEVAPVRPGLPPERIRAILFADAVNFSKLTEHQMPPFAEHFLGAIATLQKRSSHAPIMGNTWGDGLYYIFRSVKDAGQFAIELRDLIRSTDWLSKGLPHTLNMRIALHVGPVFEIRDPVTERPNFIGVHVSRGARIEPITPPGHVYASQAFAAMAAVEDISAFRCEYVGMTPLAKGYGIFPTFHVRELERH
jgi:class 3 adenylate cyclase